VRKPNRGGGRAKERPYQKGKTAKKFEKNMEGEGDATGKEKNFQKTYAPGNEKNAPKRRKK